MFEHLFGLWISSKSVHMVENFQRIKKTYEKIDIIFHILKEIVEIYFRTYGKSRWVFVWISVGLKQLMKLKKGRIFGNFNGRNETVVNILGNEEWIFIEISAMKNFPNSYQ